MRASGPYGSLDMRILVVEDHAPTIELYTEILARDGHVVVSERDGLAGRDRAIAETFDLVMCDLGLPGLDGVVLDTEEPGPLGHAALQLRAKDLPAREMLALLRELAPMCHCAGVPLRRSCTAALVTSSSSSSGRLPSIGFRPSLDFGFGRAPLNTVPSAVTSILSATLYGESSGSTSIDVIAAGAASAIVSGSPGPRPAFS